MTGKISIEKYALKLSQNIYLEHLILAEVAKRIIEQLQVKRQSVAERVDIQITTELINRLKDYLKKQLSQKFWKNIATNIINSLQEWKENGIVFQINSQPAINLPFPVEPEFESQNAKNVETMLQQSQAFVAAEELITQININNLSAEQLGSILGLISQQYLITEPLLPTIIPIPTPALMGSSLKAQTNKEYWQSNQDGFAYYRHNAKGNPNNFIEHYVSTPGDITILPWNEAQQIIDKFGFTSAKLHLIFAAHTMNQERPWESKFSLKGSDIIKELGWDKRTDLPKHKKLLEIANTAFALDCLLVKTVWIEGRNKKGQVVASTPIGRMWNILINPYGQYNIEGKIDKPDEVYITIQPGLWTQSFLNKAGGKSREALYQFGYLAQQVLKINPYHEELALRLALHLTIESRFHQNGKYKVGKLLKSLLAVPEINDARQDKRSAYNLKKRWDNALKLLIDLGWQVDFEQESYPAWLQPGNTERKPKGYLDKLLAAKITILPPAPIPEMVLSKNESKPPLATKRKSIASLTAAQVRETRQAKGWSQAKLAGWLGVSRPLISLIEKGERPISLEIAKKLEQLLETQD